ncbi:unnamed protein product [Linum trigynum]|uniref:Uncharacterized protein n=1 Tax=Linum trigynum TaxID=586398 RepID=A0AAV2EY84_9ROSI
MALLCFVLDLRGLSPSLLADLKQCLLQLANYYAVSSSRRKPVGAGDRIGLCYVFEDRSSSSVELKVAYSPQGDFSLRDFHHAVDNLPAECCLPEIGDSGDLCCRVDMKLSSVLNDQVLYSWGGRDVKKKLIVLSSYLPLKIEEVDKKLLMDAADHGVTVEFAFIKQISSLSNEMENTSSFMEGLSHLRNCSVESHIPGGGMFNGLTKRWLIDLRDEREEPLLARFNFRDSLVGDQNQILCCLSITVNQIVDDFSTCQTCRCHGSLLPHAAKERAEILSCPFTENVLGASDVVENSVRIGERTILYMPSSHSSIKLQRVSNPIEFNIIERTNLSSLSEGVVIGSSYVVTPTDYHTIGISSNEDMTKLNAQVFRGICRALYSMDQGLVCSSNGNLDTMLGAAFNCFYILQPSDNGPMLLRRLLGSEEILPIPVVNRIASPSIPQEIQSSIHAVLLKMELSDYNPLLHERGFHQKLNSLVKQSLQFGSIPAKLDAAPSLLADSSEVVDLSDGELEAIVLEEENLLKMDVAAGREEKSSSPTISEEWEQLVVVHESPNVHSSTSCISKPRSNESVLSPPATTADGSKQVDAKTWRILERLELPRQLKAKAVSPTVATTSSSSSNVSEISLPMKRPLIPFQPSQAAEQPSSSTQLMKPFFQRPKRKLRKT